MTPLIDKDLVDVGRRHLILDGDRHPVVFDGQKGHLGDGHVWGRMGDDDAIGQRRDCWP